MSKRSDEFVEQWKARNLHNQTGLDPSEYISDQAEQLVDYAEAVGIAEEELEETVGGDVVEYLREAYLKIEDPDLGFHDPD
jgi:hypothetical protein